MSPPLCDMVVHAKIAPLTFGAENAIIMLTIREAVLVWQLSHARYVALSCRIAQVSARIVGLILLHFVLVNVRNAAHDSFRLLRYALNVDIAYLRAKPVQNSQRHSLCARLSLLLPL